MDVVTESVNGHRAGPIGELVDPDGVVEVARPPVRRARGLRFPVLPGGALLAQLGGGTAAAAGLYHVAGWGVTLLVAGIASAVLGMLHEAGKV